MTQIHPIDGSVKGGRASIAGRASNAGSFRSVPSQYNLDGLRLDSGKLEGTEEKKDLDDFEFLNSGPMHVLEVRKNASQVKIRGRCYI